MSSLAIRTVGAAAEATALLGAYAASLVCKLRDFAESRSFNVPPFVLRFGHPTRRALPTAKAVSKLWEVYPPECSDSKVWEVHIHPREVSPRIVAQAALAGMASVIAGPSVKFGDDYGKVAVGLGLARGPASAGRTSWRTAVVDPESQVAVYGIADELGPFPIGALDASRVQQAKGDRNYLKALCPTCGPTSVRLSKKALETLRVYCGGSNAKPHDPARFALGNGWNGDAEADRKPPRARKSAQQPQAAV